MHSDGDTLNRCHDVIIVIATYNEAGNIRQLLDGLRDYPVIVVDDNSPNGTGDIAVDYDNVMVIHRMGKMGLASAYMRAFKAALRRRPQYVVQMDAGLTHNPDDIPYLLASAKGLRTMGGALVTGSRFYYPPPLLGARTVISLAAAWATRKLLSIPVSDATCGFRCWPATLLRSILEDIGYQTVARGHAWQIEMLYHAWQCRKVVVEVTIPYKLTNSSFRMGEVLEALRVLRALKKGR